MTPGHVFTNASPADGVGAWRVAHLDRFTALVKSIDPDAYADHHDSTPSGRLQLFASLRDNRDPVSHAMAVGELMAALAAHGFRVKVARWGGVVVTDAG